MTDTPQGVQNPAYRPTVTHMWLTNLASHIIFSNPFGTTARDYPKFVREHFSHIVRQREHLTKNKKNPSQVGFLLVKNLNHPLRIILHPIIMYMGHIASVDSFPSFLQTFTHAIFLYSQYTILRTTGHIYATWRVF